VRAEAGVFPGNASRAVMLPKARDAQARQIEILHQRITQPVDQRSVRSRPASADMARKGCATARRREGAQIAAGRGATIQCGCPPRLQSRWASTSIRAVGGAQLAGALTCAPPSRPSA